MDHSSNRVPSDETPSLVADETSATQIPQPRGQLRLFDRFVTPLESEPQALGLPAPPILAG